jgi:hypothetical protein
VSADPSRPGPNGPGLPDVVSDDALLDRLATGELSRGDRKDPAAEVLATVLADLEGRPAPRGAARRRTRRAALAVPVVVALLATPSVAAATAAGDPWAPYRSALTVLGLVEAAPASASGEARSPQALRAQQVAGAATARALGAAEAALAAGDELSARELLNEAEAALPGAGQREIGRLLGQLVALERILAAGANGTPGGPAAPPAQAEAAGGRAPDGDTPERTPPEQAASPATPPPPRAAGADTAEPAAPAAPEAPGIAHGLSQTQPTGKSAG